MLCFQEIQGTYGTVPDDHITSSPHYPQSNGFAESMVILSKKLMEHSTLDGKPWNYRLLEFRCTPISGTHPSPLKILTNRVLHSVLTSCYCHCKYITDTAVS